MSEFWSTCLSQFEQELPAQQFNTWIKTLRLEGDEPDFDASDELKEKQTPPRLQLIAPNRFVLQWVRERYLEKIQTLSHKFFPSPVSISLSLAEPATTTSVAPPVESHQETRNKPEPTAISAGLNSKASKAVRSIDTAYEKSRLTRDFTVDILVTGRANDLARAAAQQVALNPGLSYNPLFIYGGVGLGKTHLIHALGNEVWRHNPDMVIRYVHAEDYFADVVRAYQQKTFDEFKRYYRSLDLLLIDDIQFFNNKIRTQEEFFYAFNALVESKKQIVITSDTYPKDVTGLQERLISRFDWGLTVQIEPPEPEMRVAILKKKAETAKINLGDDVAFLIAKNLRSNVRELEGALNKVLAFARFQGKEVDIDLAKEALKDIFGATNRQLTMELIQKTVADYYKLKVAEMYSKKRTRAVARPRQIAMWLTRELTHHSLPEIGEAFGGRDHTTVLHACRTINDLRTK